MDRNQIQKEIEKHIDAISAALDGYNEPTQIVGLIMNVLEGAVATSDAADRLHNSSTSTVKLLNVTRDFITSLRGQIGDEQYERVVHHFTVINDLVDEHLSEIRRTLS